VFFGNNQVKVFFESAIAQNSLAQVYCLVGVDQVGKRTLAIEVASKLFKVEFDKVCTHPDFYYLNRGVDEKTGKERKEISVSQVRSLRSFLQNQSWSNGWRVVVIDEAEFLNEESGNALLKNLEEPGEKTLIFLLTNNDDSLLATIRSRAQVWRLSPATDQEIKNGLVASGCSEELASRITYLAAGRLGRALDFYHDEERLQEWEEEIRRWQEIFRKPVHERFKILESIVGEKDGLTRVETRLQKILNVWSEETARMLKNRAVNFSDDSAVRLVKIIDALSEAQELLAQNINPKMVMEKIILQF